MKARTVENNILALKCDEQLVLENEHSRVEVNKSEGGLIFLTMYSHNFPFATFTCTRVIDTGTSGNFLRLVNGDPRHETHVGHINTSAFRRMRIERSGL
jgi:hypothetical protein